MKKLIQISLIIAVCAVALRHYGAAFLASLAGLSFMIFFHELGHFAAARACGVAVRRFSLGFGGVIYARRYGRTIYQIAAVPLGGYVKMKGESAHSRERLHAASSADRLDDPRGLSTPLGTERDAKSSRDSCAASGENPASFAHSDSYDAAALHKKLLILLAGPGANLLLGWLIFVALAFAPVQDAAPVVGASSNAALRAGDEILAINGAAVRGFSEISPHVRAQNELQIRRDGQLLAVAVTAKQITERDVLGDAAERYVMGIQAAEQTVTYRRNFAQAIAAGSEKTATACSLIARSLAKLLTGAIGLENIGGIIAINDVASTAAQENAATFAAICAMISINLGIMNLLPIPVLDGGHILVLLAGAVLGQRAGAALLRYGGYLGLAALGALMLLATYNDFVHYVFKEKL